MLSFPLDLNEFMGLTRAVSVNYAPPTAGNHLQSGGGEIVTASYGPRLWSGSVVSHALNFACARPLRSRLNLLNGPGGSFIWRDPFYKGPASDPGGAILGSANVTIGSVGNNGQTITINGLPAGYELNAGDLISWQYGVPPRYAFHEIAETKTASAGGVISNIQLSLPVRAGTVGGEAVNLLSPILKARIVPGSTSLGEIERRWNSPISFRWRQTLR